jgi:hypothetical protein
MQQETQACNAWSNIHLCQFYFTRVLDFAEDLSRKNAEGLSIQPLLLILKKTN